MFRFAPEYSILAFFSTSNFFFPHLQNLASDINTNFNKYKFVLSCSLSKYDLILDISHNSHRRLIPILKNTIDCFTKKFKYKSNPISICYSLVFGKELKPLTYNTNNVFLNNNCSINRYSLTSYTFLNINYFQKKKFEKYYFKIIDNLFREKYSGSNTLISLVWNMNIFQYTIIMRANNFTEMQIILFDLLISIESKISLIKSSTIFNVNWDFDEGVNNFKIDEENHNGIYFNTYINLKSGFIKLLRNQSQLFLGGLENIQSFIKTGWFDIVLKGNMKRLSDIKSFIYDLKEKKAQYISETSTNILTDFKNE